ncbi:phosphate-starvation-inducible PsiE family protein [Tetragenococcus koreensis]|uniref:phosphate-starvation-inducible protein PsiE n=1 Tax=Tetragenococcus koreensis TaxID=290335 RepID=UPI001F40F709|nr:phosphate-starvation-inducible PsiE family protein [Tetragenococcus koreensis]MCF1585949.1 phosphate-starvation-inducible PsiE family protein [Tetragenococcus koreensis]MCF1615526.1 phosphate-starvation-inducible PsiE family protein [Tetragenococcus koreensis]MCF1620399.1 phosphate-starvation-inducible PsiE family protein [Tetragenococcus koreensis]MCF1625323.1 phosphate-starvation-inducible PsiE family protein [Tetragenococcus koreensis]MCF1630199.1 phosphate-starvation-inducible PsiE fami
MKRFDSFEKIASLIVDIMLGVLVVVLIAMGTAIYDIFTHVLEMSSMNELYYVIEEIATWFILLEIFLMLLRYVKEGHHVPVRYLILIGITAVSRKLLLEHGGGLDALMLAFAILILVVDLLLLERVRAFHTHRRSSEEEKDGF